MVACFIGHRTITVTNELCERIRTTVVDLIDNQGVDTFLFGSRSQFDELCLKIVTEIKEIRPHIRRIYVRAEYPYISADYEKYLLTFYDETYMPENIIHAGKAIYIERNRHMIDSSSTCIFYYNYNATYQLPLNPKIKRNLCLHHSPIGTKIAYEYATSKNKVILNLHPMQPSRE